MLKEEIDDIIANAVAESKGKQHRRHDDQASDGKRKKDTISIIRTILNAGLIIGAILTVAFYFIFNVYLDDKGNSLYIFTGISALCLKILEFGLRFIS